MTQKGMKINTARCKTEMEVFNINIGEERANQVTQYAYLGVEVDAQNLQDSEINRGIRKYIGNDHMIYQILKEKFVPQECKVTIYR